MIRINLAIDDVWPSQKQTPRHLLISLYVERDLSIRNVAQLLGESGESVRVRLIDEDLIKREGTFGVGLSGKDRQRCANNVGRLYNNGWTTEAIGEELQLSRYLVLQLLHEHDVPLRRYGLERAETPSLLEALYSDHEILSVLDQWQIPIQNPHQWRPPTAFDRFAPNPLPAELLRRLYSDIGLSTTQISILVGVSPAAIGRRLRAINVPLRPTRTWAPWTIRTFGKSAQHRRTSAAVDRREQVAA